MDLYARQRLGAASSLQMNVAKGALSHSPPTVSLPCSPVVLLNVDVAPRYPRHPGDMPVRARVRLRDRACLGCVVDGSARLTRRGVPEVRVAPVRALVLVVEVDSQLAVHAECDEAGALALVVVPGIDATAAPCVGIVVRHGSERVIVYVCWRLADVGNIRASIDDGIGNVAAVMCEVPDGAPIGTGAFCLASDGQLLTLCISADDTGLAIWQGVTGDGISRSRVRRAELRAYGHGHGKGSISNLHDVRMPRFQAEDS